MNDTSYITTPIYYVNDEPHHGHAYTTVLGDVLARYARLRGRDAFLLVGTDEHGQKVQDAARASGVDPQTQADRLVVRFREAWRGLHVEYDDFIRTTEERHRLVVTAVLQRLWDKGEIYRGEYEGWYCVPDERFWTDKDVTDRQCPDCGRPVEWLSEQNYFFRMGKHREWLIEHVQTHPDFILSENRRNEVLGYLRRPLGDLCISRPAARVGWGIPLPFDPGYVTYVWFDALLNYVTGDGFPSARERRAATGAPTIVIPATAGIHGWGPAMGSRLHGNDGRRRRTHNRHSRDGGNPRLGAGDGFPSARERRAAAAYPQSSFPRRRESTAGGRRWVPVCTGTTGGGGVPTIVIPVTAGIHGGGPAMGSRLHGNDGRRPAHPQSSFPRRRESTAGGRRWVPVCTGTTGDGGRTHNRHSREGGNPRLGAGDGFPSARERRAATGAPTIVIPAKAGIHGWGPAMGSRLHGNDGRRTHNRHSHNSGNPRQPHRHSRDGGNPRWGPAMGSRLHGNDGRRRAHPGQLPCAVG